MSLFFMPWIWWSMSRRRLIMRVLNLSTGEESAGISTRSNIRASARFWNVRQKIF